MTAPLEGRYLPSLAAALLALIPFIIVSTADPLFRMQVGADIGAGRTALAVVAGLSLAGYAFGALVGGDVVQRFPQHRLFLICEAAFVGAGIVAATAGGIWQYAVGRIAQGATTGLLLVIALPPVIQRFSATRLVITAAAVDVAFFGAVTAGPLVGGAVAGTHLWRGFYGALAAVGSVAWLLGWLSFAPKPPMNPGVRLDAVAIALGFAGTFLPFFGTGMLTRRGFGSLFFIVPLAVGITCFVALLLVEYHMAEPLSPVRPVWRALPIVGVLAAMVGGGIFVALLTLAEADLLHLVGLTPLATGLAFWPMVPASLIAAALLGLLMPTRWLPVYTLGGMAVVIAGGVLLLPLPRTGGRGPLLPLASALLGFGAGATVSPGLWLVGLSLPSSMVGRTFALIELVRSEADFIFAPVLLEVARVSSGGSLNAFGIEHALFVTLAVAAGATALGMAVYARAGLGLPRPDLERWLGGQEEAMRT